MRNWLAKIKAVKGLGWVLIATAFCAALLLLSGKTDAGTPLEKRLEEVLSRVEGAGAVRVMVNEYRRDQEDHVAVAIVAEGAGSVAVCLNLSRLACTLTGARAEDVEVFRMDASP